MKSDTLFALLKRGLEAGCYPGAAAAWGVGGQIYALSCIGKIADDGPAANDATLYDMASLSKILGPTMIALKALEAGTITLWDTLPEYFEAVPPDKQGINIFQLMTHTAGFIPAYKLEDEISAPDDALHSILARPLIAPPGKEPHYSCMGYIVLGRLLERLYGRPLNELAAEKVFVPLGMEHTAYCPAGDNIAATEVDTRTGKAWQGVVHDENARFLNGVSGNAGVFSDINDMALFAQMLAQNGNGYIAPVTLCRAIRCYTPEAASHRGLGFQLAGVPESFMGDLMPDCSFGHTGFTGTSLAVDPTTGFWAVLLTNRVHPARSNNRLTRFRRIFHNVLYAEFSNKRH